MVFYAQCFAFLYVSAVRKHHTQQICRSGSGINGSLVAGRSQLGQQAAVINVCMRQQYKIYRLRIKRKRLAVACLGITPALQHAAIHQKTDVAGIDQIARTRYFTRRTEKSDFHFLTP